MVKYKLLPITLTAIILLSTRSCFSTPNTSPSQSSQIKYFDPNWSELRVSADVYVKTFDGKKVNWMPGFTSFVPSGKHSMGVGLPNFTDIVNLECTFISGSSYIVDRNILEYKTEGYSNSRYSLTRTIVNAEITIREYGASSYPVIGKNESLVEFTLAGSYTQVSVDGYHYKLSSHKEDSASKLLLVLPSGKYKISSLASVNDIDLDLPPSRFLSFSVNTSEATISKKSDTPLGYLGKWRFDLGTNYYIILTFSMEGMGYAAHYFNNALHEDSGMFNYTSSDTSIAMKTGDGSFSMRYQISPDSNRVTLDNFFGQGVSLTGTRF